MAIEELDQVKVEEFMGKTIGDFAGAMSTVLTAIGDKLGLFKALAGEGPANGEELAGRTGVDARYATEWLRALHAAGYLELDRASGRYELPPEHALAFAQERGPMFLCGGYQEFLGAMQILPQLVDAFRDGGGVPQSAYPTDFWDGLSRFTAGWHENLLVQVWVPAIPEVMAKLQAGCRYADVGCGQGLALIKLAQAFPHSTFVGYDAFEGSLAGAREAAAEAGVGDRVSFELRDIAAQPLEDPFDIVSTFDVIHDAVDPVALLRGIHAGLAPNGHYLLLDINCADDPADNQGPLAALFYGFSVTYCMTTSLAHGGAGLGTCGLPPAVANRLCVEAGFSSVERVDLENPFNILYEVRP